MTDKELYCLARHYAVFYDYCKYNMVADFGVPCAACRYWDDCHADYRSMEQAIFDETGIKVLHFLRKESPYFTIGQDKKIGQSSL